MSYSFSASIVRLTLTALLGAFSIGCGKNNVPGRPSAVVAGTITLDGAALPSGMIIFASTSGSGSVSGQIIDGKFTIARTEGLAPGTYTVSIMSYKKSGRKVAGVAEDGSGQIDEVIQYIPIQYNLKTTLKQTFTDGDNSCVFELKSL